MLIRISLLYYKLYKYNDCMQCKFLSRLRPQGGGGSEAQNEVVSGIHIKDLVEREKMQKTAVFHP